MKFQYNLFGESITQAIYLHLDNFSVLRITCIPQLQVLLYDKFYVKKHLSKTGKICVSTASLLVFP